MQFPTISFSKIAAVCVVGLAVFQAYYVFALLETIGSTVAWIFLVADLYHILNFTVRVPLSEADSAGAALWLAYSWLLAGKWFVIYVELGNTWIKTADPRTKLAMTSVPVMYMLLMFRATKPLFTSMSNTITPEVMMHYEMFWTVFIDLYDIASAVQSLTLIVADGDLPENQQQRDDRTRQSQLAYPKSIQVYQQAMALFLFLGLLCHGQSFPSAEWQLPAIEKDGYIQMCRDKSKTYRQGDRGYRDFVSQLDVTFARERSALVSVFILNLPLFICRFYLSFMAFSAGMHTADNQQHLLILKNLSFIFFQSLQLRVVMRRRRELVARYTKMSANCQEAVMPSNSGVLLDTTLFLVIGIAVGTLISWQADIADAFDFGWTNTSIFDGVDFPVLLRFFSGSQDYK